MLRAEAEELVLIREDMRVAVWRIVIMLWSCYPLPLETI
jgi:hypothetical protein